MKKGDRLRVRRLGSDDDWCMGVVELVSPNGMSMGFMVEHGGVRPEQGGIVTGFLAVSLMRGTATEIATATELEIQIQALNEEEAP